MLLDFACHLVVAVTFALSTNPPHGERRIAMAAGMWALLLFELLLVTPIMLTLMRLNVEWYFLYLFDIPKFEWHFAVARIPLVGLGVLIFFGTHSLQASRSGWIYRILLTLTSTSAAAAIVFAGWPRISVIGPRSAVVLAGKTRPLLETTEGFVAIGGLLLIGFGWFLTTRSLLRYSRALPYSTQDFVAAIPNRGGLTKKISRT